MKIWKWKIKTLIGSHFFTSQVPTDHLFLLSTKTLNFLRLDDLVALRQLHHVETPRTPPRVAERSDRRPEPTVRWEGEGREPKQRPETASFLGFWDVLEWFHLFLILDSGWSERWLRTGQVSKDLSQSVSEFWWSKLAKFPKYPLPTKTWTSSSPDHPPHANCRPSTHNQRLMDAWELPRWGLFNLKLPRPNWFCTKGLHLPFALGLCIVHLAKLPTQPAALQSLLPFAPTLTNQHIKHHGELCERTAKDLPPGRCAWLKSIISIQLRPTILASPLAMRISGAQTVWSTKAKKCLRGRNRRRQWRSSRTRFACGCWADPGGEVTPPKSLFWFTFFATLGRNAEALAACLNFLMSHGVKSQERNFRVKLPA